ncbi:P3H3 hydroxylase, partial [Amia calva]|nr:P3H3 hydroxylase [Amia calva]
MIEKSLSTRAELLRTRRLCHDSCATEGALSRLDRLGGSLWELAVWGGLQRRAECLSYCLRGKVAPAALAPVSMETLQDFHSKNPYNYLQVTYYKLNRMDRAAAAAHTFYVSNPSHLEMRNNLQKYRRMKGVKEEAFQDRESEKHWALYDSAMQAEGSSNWLQAAKDWRECVNETLATTDKCRAQCAGEGLPPDTHQSEPTEGLYERVAVLSLYLLSCRQSCVSLVAIRPGRISPMEDFLPFLLEHLHLAEFKAGLLQEAVSSVRALLLFTPEDQDSLSNLQIYLQTLGGDVADSSEPREDISHYVTRSLAEKELLYFASENLGFNFTDPDLWTPENIIPQSLREARRAEREELNNREERRERERETDDSGFYAGGPIPLPGVSVTMDDVALNGTNRVVLDGVLSPEECGIILGLATAAVSSGDGYRGRRSPHTPHEKFQGLTVLRALRLSQEGRVSQSDARLLYDISERVRALLQSYFRSPSHLFFSFTHLVCRSAVTGDQEGRTDLSHPIHVDNCLLEPETRQCWREPPAFTHRDLSALLYLNDDFQGGQLIFTDRDAKTVTASVSPQCGRLVGFSSGPVNPHGVYAVTAGRRCALAMWFTLERKHRDMEREEVDAVWGAEGQKVMAEKEDESPQPPRSGRSEGGRGRRVGRERGMEVRDEL